MMSFMEHQVYDPVHHYCIFRVSGHVGYAEDISYRRIISLRVLSIIEFNSLNIC